MANIVITGANQGKSASSKGALESLAKCLGLEYAQDGISFHIIHPPLTRTKSSHSVGQKVQTLCCYLFPVKMGRLLSKMTMNCAEKPE